VEKERECDLQIGGKKKKKKKPILQIDNRLSKKFLKALYVSGWKIKFITLPNIITLQTVLSFKM